ncbi:survival of motor neuron-related-splicing factor 30-like [Lineus longissimus]|uniref:survival of motor neuron-related-splicing factor 30-like n=1 Tax=Lineus longissimus TaxID=88925 RepID=UPI002B4CA833
MADELAAYKSQLQQVEAALTTDPDNEELLKLKTDLLEVLQLTKELVSVQSTTTDASSSSKDGEDWLSGVPIVTEAPAPKWKVGDKCLSYYAEDGGMYEATIDEILEDGSCTVTYDGYDITEVTQMAFLQQIENSNKRAADGEGDTRPTKMKKKDIQIAQREYKRKKNQKKAQRQKQMEEERETEKNKWLSFTTKVAKSGKGHVKKSIFATPEAATGRVGVGTCGVSGKPMTEYSHQQKWKK